METKIFKNKRMNLDILNLYFFSFQFDIKETTYINIMLYIESEIKNKYIVY